ncbi:hypothetical protein [Plantibacter sp. M259]|uniref:hypothetical protein n=1 Tax=Plantibacter sp. M259 TaxID=2583822 RepID=UPI001110255F|nr:hypothetical protein [Plantibacter sp. M259]
MNRAQSVGVDASNSRPASTEVEGYVSETILEAFRRLVEAAAAQGRDAKLILAVLHACIELWDEAGDGVFESAEVGEGQANRTRSHESRAEPARPSLGLAATERIGAIVDSWSDDETAGFLGVGLRQVRRRAQEGTLFYFTIAKKRRYPIWQFSPQRGTLAGIWESFSSVPDSWMPEQIQRFMTSADAGLRLHGVPIAPIEWLALGLGPEDVVDLLRKTSRS